MTALLEHFALNLLYLTTFSGNLRAIPGVCVCVVCVLCVCVCCVCVVCVLCGIAKHLEYWLGIPGSMLSYASHCCS